MQKDRLLDERALIILCSTRKRSDRIPEESTSGARATTLSTPTWPVKISCAPET
jgi:hypothetical protein